MHGLLLTNENQILCLLLKVIHLFMDREPDPEGKLPEESLNASGLKKCFLRKGFS